MLRSSRRFSFSSDFRLIFQAFQRDRGRLAPLRAPQACEDLAKGSTSNVRLALRAHDERAAPSVPRWLDIISTTCHSSRAEIMNNTWYHHCCCCFCCACCPGRDRTELRRREGDVT